MSAYEQQMQREYSVQSLTSRGNSEVESQYSTESGFYMTSFAGAIFIGGLVTVGVLLITLLVALAVMLQSCQSRSAGVVEIVKSTDDYSYCKIFALHAELNGLEADQFPAICRLLFIQYIKGGQYARDLNFTIWMAEDYFSTRKPLDDGLDAVLIDIDEIFASSPRCTNLVIDRFGQCGTFDGIEEANHLKQRLTLKLFISLQGSGWSVILISRKAEGQRNATTELLISAGYRGWSSLIMRSENEMQMDSRGYLSRRRTLLQKEGFRMAGAISSHMDALTGQSLGKRVFKLPNAFYYDFDHATETDSRKVA